MITLKEAFKLCHVDDKEVVHFQDSVKATYIDKWPMTGKETREKYDMKNTMVAAILPHFCMGEFEGFCFVIRKP